MPQPNFVYIMTDSQGAINLGCYGQPDLITPNLDRLAARGVRFDRAYSTCPVCGPARSGIFTGQYPHTAGVWANELPLSNVAKTMGQRFGDQGYRTAYVGKWHLSGQDYFDTGVAPDGWDKEYWYDGRNYMAELTPEERRLWRQVLASTEALLKYDVPAEFTWGHRISDRAVKFLQEKQDKPFVLALSYDEPHGPCTCPAKYVKMFENYIWDPGPSRDEDMSNKPAFHRALRESARRDQSSNPDGRMKFPPFFAANTFIDEEIGRVLDAIDKFAPPNTYVIFTSDHGQFQNAHGLVGKGLAMYEESARIPLLIRGPGIAAGSADPTPVSHIDILPTMLDLAGLQVPGVLDGESLKANLQEGARNPEREVAIEWNRSDADGNGGTVHGGFFPARCLEGRRYKLVINLFDSDEFYDLQEDPHEINNRINDASSAAIRDEMHNRLLRWMNDKRDPFRGQIWGLRPWHSAPAELFKGATYRADDGYLPPTLDYWTGKPHERLRK